MLSKVKKQVLLKTHVLSCEICKIFKNSFFEEHLQTNASEHRSSFLEVFYRSCCSALINTVMKYSFSAAVTQSCRALHANLLKIALHYRYFSKNFTSEQQYWKNRDIEKCIFWGRIYFGNIPAWLLLKGSCNCVPFRNSDTYLNFLLWRHVKEKWIFMIFFFK